MIEMLQIGDEVMWSGAWGSEPPTIAIVESITLTDGINAYIGDSYYAVEWTICNDRRVIVDLNNGHWAYGYQVRPLQ